MVTRIEAYSYELTPESSAPGSGWLLRLLLDDHELGRRVFPPLATIADEQLARVAAHDDALALVTSWLASIRKRPPTMRPRPADESGMYLMMPDDELLCTVLSTDKGQPFIVEWPKDSKLDSPAKNELPASKS
ncbi:hypothetical protein J2X54_001644 [Duganella sp. 3397]|uniref:hypothetical protein n=1 Tax=Duganella sp. 3397 TaxID=2817732 RepID=UPI0028655CD2|nr:hypothetical protein [Duganella sp. 3397]MDR7049196.1 hypothetical protein [Duganella sp. 3397]